jgi:WhiB family redox-sensing transcriptional regulator
VTTLELFEGALCRDLPSGYMYPSPGATEEIRAAIAVCKMCPAIEPCLQRARDNDEHHGVWGGVFLEERRRWRR